MLFFLSPLPCDASQEPNNRNCSDMLVQMIFSRLGGFSSFDKWPPVVESSIAVEDAVENRDLYRVFASHLF